MTGRWVLGISCDFHDAAAALIVDGTIVAAIEEERLSRLKHDASLPERAVASCLAIAGISPDDLEAVVFHEKPLAVAGRVLATRQRRGLRSLPGFARDMPTMVGQNLLVGYRIERMLRRLGARRSPDIRYGEHHLSHASAAFHPSPFESAAILTVDGVGEWATTTVGRGGVGGIDLLAEQRFPDSPGLLYSLATVWCGFAANDGEYKLMGLAPYGRPRFREAIESLVATDEDGALHVDAPTVRWWGTDVGRSGALAELFDGPPLLPGADLTQRELDLARSVQDAVEEIVLRMARHAHGLTGETALCLGGGVALNCVANGRLLREGPFDDVWVQPAPGDAGSAIGAALWHWHDVLGMPRPPAGRSDGHGHGGANRRTRSSNGDGMAAAALGPSFSGDEVEAWLAAEGVDYEAMPDLERRSAHVARALRAGAVVGWFEGAMEFGPRALGHRSILADPRDPLMQRRVNERVKGRESFRPFAPAILADHAADWFELDRPSPYMLVTCQVAADHLVDVDDEPSTLAERAEVVRSDIPACTHVDGSARVQTVAEADHPAFHALLTEFNALTGCPVLLNTSFNVAGEPIVCTPADALETARTAGLDLLVVEHCVISFV